MKSFGGSFFDSKKVIASTTAAERKVLSRFGAIVRTRARRSIRKRKKTSQVGRPPSSHTGLLRKKIFFGFDVGRRSVVIGPQKFKTGSALQALEYGGRSTDTKGRRIKIKARPFMGPAFADALPELPSLWRNSIR